MTKLSERLNLPRALKHYKKSDFAIQQKARFIFYLCLLMIASLLLTIASSIYIQYFNSQNNEIYQPVILPQVALLVLLIVCLFIIIKGYYGLSAHFLMVCSFLCVWFIMIIDSGDIITRLDTVVMIVALLNMAPLFITKYKTTILLYILINILVLITFIWIFGEKIGLSNMGMVDYVMDTSIAMIFTGILGYIIFTINKKTLDKALSEINDRKKAEFELLQSRDQFQSLVSNIPGITYRCRHDMEWTMLYISSEVDKISGYPTTDFINNQVRSYKSIINAEDSDYVKLEIDKAIKSLIPWEVKYRIWHKNGTIRWVYEKGKAATNSSGKADFLDGFILDITESKLAEIALREEELRYRTLFENAQIGIYRTTPDGKILKANPALIDMLGYESFADLKKRDLEVDKVYVDSNRIYFKELIENQGILKDFESKWKKKNGETIILLENANIVRNSDGETIYYDGFIENITERKKAEKSLLESKELFKTLAQISPVGIFRTHKDGYTTYVNPKWLELFGLCFEEALGNGWLKAVHPDDRQMLATNWNEKVSKGEKSIAEYRFLKPNGNTVWVLGESVPEIIEDEIKGYIGTLTDITERKKTENALKQSEELFKSLIELAPYAIVLNDSDGHYLMVNNAFTRDTGYKAEEVLGKNILEIGLVLDGDKDEFIRQELLNNGKVENLEAFLIDKSGNKQDLYYSSRMIQLQNQKVILSSIINVTEKKKIERELEKHRDHLEYLVKERTEELQQNIEELQTTKDSLEIKNNELNRVQLELLNEKKLIDALMDSIPDAIYFKDLQSRFLKVSKSMQANLSKDNSSGVLGKTDFDFFTEEHASRAFADEQLIIRTGEPIVELIEKETWKDGRITFASTNKMPLYDANGHITGTFGISRDITRMIEMEAAIKKQNEELVAQREELSITLSNLKQAQKQLVQSEKMASLGVLAAGVAHEINNPLNFINGGILGLENYFIENLQNHLPEVTPLINGIHVGVSRAADIVASLNHYSRRDDFPRTECNIHSIIDNCLLMLQSETKNRIDIMKNYSQNHYRLICNEGKLHQAILNILANACQAIENIGSISITTKIDFKKLFIIIADTGCGINKEIMPKIFDPFFTTKEPGKGTGLGLSITYNIIQEHNGNIEMDSNEGKGTKVIIRLPLNTKADI